jgi:outer membrane protein TolC
MKASINIVIFTLLWSGSAALAVDGNRLEIGLDDAIAKALSSHSELKILGSKRQQADFASYGLFGTLLPTVTLSRQWTQSTVAISESSNRVQRDAYNLLTVEERIGNPYKIYNNLKIAGNNVEIADADVRAKIAELRARVRVQYFKVAAARIAVENATKNLEVARQSVENGRKRFNGGFIHSSDATRIEVNYKIIESSLDEKKDIFRDETAKLALLIGVDAKTDIENKTKIPTDFNYFSIDERALFERIKTKNSEELKKLQLQATNSDLSLRNYEASFYPDLSFSARYAGNPQDPDFVGRHERGPSFYLIAEWELFNGGRANVDYSRGVADKFQASERLRQFQMDFDAEVEQFVRGLFTQKKQYLIAKDNTALTKSVFESSRERFNRGLIDSGRVNDDMQDYLDQEGKLLEISLKIIETLAALAKSTGNEKLFDELI